MKTLTQEPVRHALTAILGSLIASLFCISGVVNAQESEPNDVGSDALGVCVPAGEELFVTADLQNGTDKDVFWFDATAGNAPRIMVNSGSDANFDSILILYKFDATVLIQNDDPPLFSPMNEGSTTNRDSRIEDAALADSGRYYVMVSAAPHVADPATGPFAVSLPTLDGGTGSYTLRISGVTAPAVLSPDSSCGDVVAEIPEIIPDDTGDGDTVKPITIEVRNWTGRNGYVSKRWKRHVRRMGKKRGIYPIPVAMLSSESFNAMDIDEESLTFGPEGGEDSLFRCSKRGWDVNRDGMKDKMCFFDAYKTGFEVNDIQGYLNGTTNSGQAFQSTATLKMYKISPHKKKRRSRHHRHHSRHHHSKWRR